MNKFAVIASDSQFYNRQEFLEFLVANQGQDIVIWTYNEGMCLQSTGVYDLLQCFQFGSVEIQTANAIEHHPLYTVSVGRAAWRFFDLQGKVDYQQFHRWNGQQRFAAFYNRPSWHRMGLAAHLLLNHREQSLINFRYDPADEQQRREFGVQQLYVHQADAWQAARRGEHVVVTTGTASGTVDVSWDAPTNLGTPALTQYQTRYSIDAGVTFSAWSNTGSTATSRTITCGAGETCVVQVRAVNSIGTGSSASDTAVAADVPAQLTGFSATAKRSASASISAWLVAQGRARIISAPPSKRESVYSERCHAGSSITERVRSAIPLRTASPASSPWQSLMFCR